MYVCVCVCVCQKWEGYSYASTMKPLGGLEKQLLDSKSDIKTLHQKKSFICEKHTKPIQTQCCYYKKQIH